jgi:flagellar basal-body rod protein FlgC
VSFNVNTNGSALQAFSRQIQVSANNVANSQTDGFKSSKALNYEGQKGQVGTVISRDESAGPLVEDPLKNDGSLKELSNTDIAREMVQQISAQRGFEANTKPIQTWDQTVGSLIDVIG